VLCKYPYALLTISSGVNNSQSNIHTALYHTSEPHHILPSHPISHSPSPKTSRPSPATPTTTTGAASPYTTPSATAAPASKQTSGSSLPREKSSLSATRRAISRPHAHSLARTSTPSSRCSTTKTPFPHPHPHPRSKKRVYSPQTLAKRWFCWLISKPQAQLYIPSSPPTYLRCEKNAT
jgi:hypothetical protein